MNQIIKKILNKGIYLIFISVAISSSFLSQNDSIYVRKNIAKLDKYCLKIQKTRNVNFLQKYYLHKFNKINNIDKYNTVDLLYFQEINNKVENAKQLSYNGHFEQSNEICFTIIKENSKYKFYNNLSELTYDLISKNYAYLNDTNNCKIYATKHCKSNIADLDFFFNPVIISILGSENINELSRIQDSVFLKKNFEKSISFESVFLIRYLIKKDQFLRLTKEHNELKINECTKELESMLDIIISKHFFPNEVLIDDETIIYFNILYAHTSSTFQLKHLKKYADFLETKEHHKDGVKLIIDKILVHKYNEQLYGTQSYGKDGKCVPFPLTKRTESEIRKELGLE